MKDDHVKVLLENIESQIQRLAEAMADVPDSVKRLQSDMTEVKADVKVIKALVKDHKTRITTLEPSQVN